MVLSVPFEDIERGLSEDQLKHLKKTGVIIIRGGVPREVRHAALSACAPRMMGARRADRLLLAGSSLSRIMSPPTAIRS